MEAETLAALQDASFARAGAATRESYPPENRMSGETLHRFLEARRYLVAATTRPDGRPHIAPTAYLLDADSVWLPTTAGAARLRNVAGTPHVSLALTEGEGDIHGAVLMEGAASIVAGAAAPPRLMESWRAKHSSDGSWIADWIVVRPSRLFSYAASRWRPAAPSLR
jgi:general stress protein 26